MMRRRERVTLVGGEPGGWPVVAGGQQAMPVIGFWRRTSPADSVHLVTAFRHGLKESGFVEGQNCSIEYRWADNHFDQLPALVANLLRWPVTLIVGTMRRLPPKPRPRPSRLSLRAGVIRTLTAL